MEIRSVDDVTNVRDEGAGSLFCAVIVGRFSGEPLKLRVEVSVLRRRWLMDLRRIHLWKTGEGQRV